MKVLNYKRFRESAESQSLARRHNPATVIKADGRRHVLPVGDSDDWECYLDHGRVYCVSINRSLGYCGVQGYDIGDEEPREELSVFCQSDEAVIEAVGPRGLDYTDRTIANRLVAMLNEVTA